MRFFLLYASALALVGLLGLDTAQRSFASSPALGATSAHYLEATR